VLSQSLQQIFKPATGSESSFSFISRLIDNSALQARPELDQALLQLVHIIHTLLCTAPNTAIALFEVHGKSSG